jgi:hypothetical protein
MSRWRPPDRDNYLTERDENGVFLEARHRDPDGFNLLIGMGF